LFYQVVFQQERILLTCHNHILDIRYMCHQLTRLGRLVLFAEIAVHPPMQVLGLPDIDNLSFFVKVLVNTRLFGYSLQQ
jgi:hypothetical protein